MRRLMMMMGVLGVLMVLSTGCGEGSKWISDDCCQIVDDLPKGVYEQLASEGEDNKTQPEVNSTLGTPDDDDDMGKLYYAKFCNEGSPIKYYPNVKTENECLSAPTDSIWYYWKKTNKYYCLIKRGP